MSENKVKTNLDAIEKLIVDGQKDVVKRIEELADGQSGLQQQIDRLDQKVDALDKKLDTNSQALYDLLQDTKKDVNRVETKLDAHLVQPAHA